MQVDEGRRGMDNPIKAVEDAKDVVRSICEPHVSRASVTTANVWRLQQLYVAATNDKALQSWTLFALLGCQAFVLPCTVLITATKFFVEVTSNRYWGLPSAFDIAQSVATSCVFIVTRLTTDNLVTASTSSR